MSRRVLDFEGVVNARDIGGYRTADGYRVRWSVVLRAGHLSTPTAADVEKLADLGITASIDYRSDIEVERAGPDVLPKGVEWHRIPMGNPTEGSVDLFGAMSRADPDELHALFSANRAADEMRLRTAAAAAERAAGHARMLARVKAAGGAPVIVHCTAGKDRTGAGIALLLTLLGVDRETVMADYLLSNEVRRDEIDAQVGALPESTRPILRAFTEVRPDYLDAVFDRIDEVHGSWDDFVAGPKGLGLAAAAIDDLRSALLE